MHLTGNVHGSPFRCFVSPAAACSSATLVTAPKLSAFTAGVPAVFTVAARDLYGNVQSQLGSIVGYASKAGLRHAYTTVVAEAGVGSKISFLCTSAGTATLSAFLAISTGLSATYYDDADGLASPATSRVDNTVDFSLASGVKPAALLSSVSTYAVRWRGFVRPSVAVQEYTFYASTQDASQRIKLWVSNMLIVDAWTSLSATEGSGTVLFSLANAYYDITMEYKMPANTGQPHGAGLKWSGASGSIPKAVIPVDRLSQAQLLLSGESVFLPNSIDAPSTIATGNALSLVTAGVYSAFTVRARDAYANARPCMFGQISMYTDMLPPDGSFSSDCSNGNYEVQFLPQVVAGVGYPLHVLAGSEDIQNSPFPTTVLVGVANSTTSVITGYAFTLATAGVSASFSISARDSYGSLQTEGNSRFVMYAEGQLLGTVAVSNAGVYTASYVVTRSALYSTEVFVAPFSGLLLSVDTSSTGEYTGQVVTNEEQRSISFYGSPSPFVDGTTYFAAKWEGLIWPPSAQTYSFFAQVADAKDRIRLWIDNALVIDQWNSLTLQMSSGMHDFANTGGRHFVLEYKHYQNTGGLSLQWGADYPNHLPRQDMPTSYFSGIPYAGTGRQSTLDVLIGPLTGSVLISNSLTLMTAGTLSAFTINARDGFGNIPSTSSFANFVGHLHRPLTTIGGSRSAHAVITKTAGNMYSGSFAVPLVSASGYSLSVFQPGEGGLFATYYVNTGLVPSAAKSARVDASIDFSHAAGIRNAASLSASAAFSVRWTGLLQPQFAQTYTFFCGVRSTSERVRLWIDNSIVVDAWESLGQTESSGTMSFGSLNGYYSVFVEYHQQASSSALNGLTLSWETGQVQKAPVPGHRFYKHLHVSNSPFSATVYSAEVCASTSTTSGISLAGTVPYVSSFTITARDAYDNLLDGTDNRASFLVRAATTDGR
jgi:hypothetical protein